MPVSRRRPLLTALAVVALVVGCILVVVLFAQAVLVYFTIEGTPPPATEAEGTRYLVTASACLGCMIAALLLAVVRRGRAGVVLGILAVAGILLALAAAFVFAVPRDRFEVPAPTYPLPSNYDPCYSGSDDCN